MKSHFRLLWPLYLSMFLFGLIFITPIWILFVQSKGLSLTDVGFMATFVYLGSVLFEYPTGIFADKFGRKKSLMMTLLLQCLFLGILVIGNSKIYMYIGAFLNGVGWAFSSGAIQALVYDKLKENKLEKLNSKSTGWMDIFRFSGAFISSLLGSILYEMNATYPFLLSIFSYILAAIILTFFLKEPKYKEKNAKIEIYRHFKEGIKLIFNKPVLLSLLILYFPLFLFEESWSNANQSLLTGMGFPVLALGVYFSIVMLARIVGGFFLPKLVGKISHFTLILITIILESLVWIFLGSNFLYVVIASSIILSLLHQFWNYIDADMVHEHIPSNIRATALSARQMMISFVWIPVPWLMGYLVNNFDRNYLFPIYGLIVLIVGIILFMSRRKHL